MSADCKLLFQVGDVAVIRFECRVVATNALTDPASATAEVNLDGAPETTVTLADMTREAQGVYTLEIPCAEAGDYTVRIVTTGAASAVRRVEFKVQA